MNRVFIIIGFVEVGFLILSCGLAVFAQGERQDLSSEVTASQSCLSGSSERGNNSTTAETGRAEGLGNSLLGGCHPLYRLRPSDVVEVTFTVAPEFNQTLTIQPDGCVTLKDAGAVLAQGLTLPQLAEAVRAAYTGYLHNPEVAVALKDFERPYFVVGGEVGKPGKYDLRSDTTVAEAVQMAGGFTSQAKHSQVVLFRRVNDDLFETRLLNLKQMLKQRNLKEDAHLRPGDLVFVPQNTISKISRFLGKPSTTIYMNPTQF
jgi:polysaccharide export outer membrane protein